MYLGKNVKHMLIAVPGPSILGIVSVARSPEEPSLASDGLEGSAKRVPGRQHVALEVLSHSA
jgi:hypothetical protein